MPCSDDRKRSTWSTALSACGCARTASARPYSRPARGARSPLAAGPSGRSIGWFRGRWCDEREGLRGALGGSACAQRRACSKQLQAERVAPAGVAAVLLLGREVVQAGRERQRRRQRRAADEEPDQLLVVLQHPRLPAEGGAHLRGPRGGPWAAACAAPGDAHSVLHAGPPGCLDSRRAFAAPWTC